MKTALRRTAWTLGTLVVVAAIAAATLIGLGERKLSRHVEVAVAPVTLRTDRRRPRARRATCSRRAAAANATAPTAPAAR